HNVLRSDRQTSSVRHGFLTVDANVDNGLANLRWVALYGPQVLGGTNNNADIRWHRPLQDSLDLSEAAIQVQWPHAQEAVASNTHQLLDPLSSALGGGFGGEKQSCDRVA